MQECLLCGDECEIVSHVLLECPAYSSSLGSNFLVALHGKLGGTDQKGVAARYCVVDVRHVHVVHR